MRDITNIIWDLDGTLIDVRSGVHKSVDYVARKHGLRIMSPEERAQMIAIPRIQDGFDVIYKLGERRSALCAREFREIYLQKYLLEAALYPDVLDVLHQFQTMGIKQAIATGKGMEHARNLCMHFGIDKFCSPIVGASSIHQKKIHILEGALNSLFIHRRECIVVIGDNEADRDAAMELGVHFQGVNYGYGFRNVPGYANAPKEILNCIERVIRDNAAFKQ